MSATDAYLSILRKRLGQPSDADSIDSLFGRFDRTLDRVGTTGEAANAAGSLMARSKYVTDRVVDLGSYTAARAALLDRLDANVSSRSSHNAGDVWSVATRALTDKAGFALSAAGVDAVWDEVVTGTTTARTAVARLDAAISSRSSHSAADVWTSATRTLTQTVSSHSAADVWAVASRALTDKAGFALSAAGVDAVWDEIVDGAALTARTAQARLDVAVSSRSSHAAADVWAVGTRALTDKAGFSLAADAVGASQFTQGAADKAWTSATRSLTDKAGFSLSAAGVDAVWDEVVTGTTTARVAVARLDVAISSRSSHNAADVWTVASRALTDKAGFALSAAGVDGVWDEIVDGAALTARTAQARLDAAVSSRLASSAYTAPDNAGIAAIKAKTDALPTSVWADATRANGADVGTIKTTLGGFGDTTRPGATGQFTVSGKLGRGSDAAGVQFNDYDTMFGRLRDLYDRIVGIKAKTDALTPGNLDTTVSSRAAPGAAMALTAAAVDAVWDEVMGSATTARTFLTRLDAAVSTRLAASSYTAPDNAGVAAIKAKTDALTPGNLDTTVSSRAAPGAAMALTAAAVDAVWDEVMGSATTARTFLTRIDVATSTRLAASSYTAPDNAGIAKAATQPVTPFGGASDVSTSSAYTTVRTITGRGYLDTLAIYATNWHWLKLTIDGTAYYAKMTNGNSWHIYRAAPWETLEANAANVDGAAFVGGKTDADLVYGNCNIRFNTSLVIALRTDVASATAKIRYGGQYI